MDTLADLVARDRRSDRPALRTEGRELDYRRFCTTAWKAGNFLRHLGVAPGRNVVVAPVPSPPPVCTFLGAALLGAPTRFSVDPEAIANARAVVVPAEREAEFDPGPGTKLVVFGAEPTESTTEYWEGGVWSENPAYAPSTVTPEDPVLRTDDRAVSHGDLLAAGERVVDTLDVTADDVVELRASLADPRAVAAGVVAPLQAGACARLVEEEGWSAEAEGTVRCGEATLSLAAVEL